MPSPRAKDPGGFTALDKEYQQKPITVGVTDDELSVFAFRVRWVAVNAREGICENTEWFLERDAMPAKVRGLLARIQLKSHGRSRNMEARQDHDEHQGHERGDHEKCRRAALPLSSTLGRSITPVADAAMTAKMPTPIMAQPVCAAVVKAIARMKPAAANTSPLKLITEAARIRFMKLRRSSPVRSH